MSNPATESKILQHFSAVLEAVREQRPFTTIYFARPYYWRNLPGYLGDTEFTPEQEQAYRELVLRH